MEKTLSKYITVNLHPGSKQNKVVIDNNGYSIWVTAQPENSKANTACLRLLAKYLNVSSGRLEIIRGFTSRRKTIKIIQ
jgi:uncharacterized protein YggU (UPF0235/DUF167 family)